MVTRLGFVAKIECFSPQNGDENGVRRQYWAIPPQNGDENTFRRQN
ncbi:hypothetical protein V6C20_08990 [Caldibacillus thermoamylovorans]